ncbi:hypothetical protein SH668x_000095 [Planctomicrobium sp. SH668]|uniref:hypothetical protein n=1 Tax=Planctomicrobium sp. SH668 TaxID=3448126 RepID=UPI003F5BB9DC
MPKRSQPQAKESTPAHHNGPAATLRQGNLKCVIWRNQGERGAWYNAELVRTFKDESGYHDTNKIPADDLLRVAFLAQQAFGKVQELRAGDREATHSDGPDEPAPY